MNSPDDVDRGKSRLNLLEQCSSVECLPLQLELRLETASAKIEEEQQQKEEEEEEPRWSRRRRRHNWGTMKHRRHFFNKILTRVKRKKHFSRHVSLLTSLYCILLVFCFCEKSQAENSGFKYISPVEGKKKEFLLSRLGEA